MEEVSPRDEVIEVKQFILEDYIAKFTQIIRHVIESEPFKKFASISEVVWENPRTTIFMSMWTLWALFSDSIRLAATDQSADSAFEIVISIAFFFFIFEIIFTCVYKKEYGNFPDWTPRPNESPLDLWIRRITFGSFFFWLDIIATISLIFDVSIEWPIIYSVIFADSSSFPLDNLVIK